MELLKSTDPGPSERTFINFYNSCDVFNRCCLLALPHVVFYVIIALSLLLFAGAATIIVVGLVNFAILRLVFAPVRYVKKGKITPEQALDLTEWKVVDED